MIPLRGWRIILIYPLYSFWGGELTVVTRVWNNGIYEEKSHRQLYLGGPGDVFQAKRTTDPTDWSPGGKGPGLPKGWILLVNEDARSHALVSYRKDCEYFSINMNTESPLYFVPRS